MLVKALADTGALLACLDRDDPWHSRCLNALPLLHLPMPTSLAVLTELFHLLGDDRRDVTRAWAFLRSGVVTVLPIGDADTADLAALMDKYHGRLGLADATLVTLAEREGLSTVFTLDHDDFETYRIGGRRRFRILPGR
jgi:predicted nucleic acid-binding protein